MKPSSPSSLLWALGVLVITASSTARAGDPAEWTCESCPFEKAETTGSVDVGIGGLSGDQSAKFGDYTGLQDEGVYGIAGGDVRYRSDSGYYGDASASDLGLDTRRVSASGGKEGSYEVRFGYSEIPRHFAQGSVTPFLGAGTGVQTLPSGFPVANTASIPASAFTPVDIGYIRSSTELGGKLYTGDAWTHKLSVRHDVRDGTRLTSGSFYSSASQLVAPVDQTTDQIEASSTYRAEKWDVTFGYYGSVFNNDQGSLTWANPFTPVVAGATAGQLALAPDNQFHQILANGSYRPLDNLRLSADIAAGRMTQDADYLSPTLNPTLAVPALPASSLDGRVDTFNGSFRAAYTPFEALRINASYAHNEHDNKTNSLAYPAVATDMFVSPLTRSNQPFSFKQDVYKLNADYRGPSWLKSSAGLDGDNRSYTRQAVGKTNELTVWGRAGAQVNQYLSVSAKYAHSNRDNDGYEAADWVTPPENPFMRNYNLADRQRDTGSLLVDITPADGWTIGAHLDLSNDRYTDSTVGLTEGRSNAVGADLNGAVTETTRVRLYFEIENTRSNQAGSSTGGRPDWTAQTTDWVNFNGIGLTQLALDGKLELRADYSWTNSENKVMVTQGIDSKFPTANATVQTFKLHASYLLQKNLWLNGDYWYEAYRSHDWRYDGVDPTTVPNFLAVGEEAPNYSVNVIGVSVRYRF
ncbi:MtrB/PioB family decaheme-associated outer membrane protein [Niveibacterium sp. SC-1]|uniref:MtrB/PioB family decaheme-associated outer membrane protein n=1 Tax=Niveibacterium sp. SC-1 TaxID=3135646 RepID=UPI00311F1FC2